MAVTMTTTVQLLLDNSNGRTDGAIKIGMARQWAIDHCSSFIQDPVLFDFKSNRRNNNEKSAIVVNMRFVDQGDAMLFKLIWL